MRMCASVYSATLPCLLHHRPRWLQAACISWSHRLFSARRNPRLAEELDGGGGMKLGARDQACWHQARSHRSVFDDRGGESISTKKHRRLCQAKMMALCYLAAAASTRCRGSLLLRRIPVSTPGARRVNERHNCRKLSTARGRRRDC